MGLGDQLEFEPKIKTLLASEISEFHMQEILFVLTNIKEVARQGMYDDELDYFLALMNDIGLFVVVSPFKVIPFQQNGYSEGGLRVNLDDLRSGMRFVYVSADEKSAHLACLFDVRLDDERLGQILGYPSCCIDYFKQRFSPENVDLSIIDYEPLIDISHRKEGYCLLSHFPCSSHCLRSVEIAQGGLKILEKFWPQRADELKNRLHLVNIE